MNRVQRHRLESLRRSLIAERHRLCHADDNLTKYEAAGETAMVAYVQAVQEDLRQRIAALRAQIAELTEEDAR